jgi:hypothetical protein
MPTLEGLIGLLERYRFAGQTENELQAAIARAFEEEAIAFEREYRLSPQDRIDFKVGRVGIEVKIGGSNAALIRQVHRYAQSDALDSIIIVTTRASHYIPADSVNGRTVVMVSLVMGNAF